MQLSYLGNLSVTLELTDIRLAFLVENQIPGADPDLPFLCDER
jgi:hypothetical protein